MIKQLKTIYKRNNSGKILEWYLEIDGPRYRTISGQQDGKKTTSAYTIAKPKNIGKINSTTAEEQALLECEAKYVKKLAQGGYKLTVEKIDVITFIKPMLAQKYEDRVPTQEMYKDGLIIIQPKLDGVRCICSKDGMFTRQGKVISGAPHIQEALIEVFKYNPNLILDGELYNHKLKNNFNEIISLVKKEKPDKDKKAKSKELIQYHVYDLISSDNYSERHFKLRELLENTEDKSIQILDSVTVNSEKELLAMYEKFILEGYEGAMLRINNVGYEHKRSKSLLKIKKFIDEEFKIIELLEGEGNNSGMVGRVKLLTKDGKEFGANMTGTWEQCVELLKIKEDYKNGEATVKYFELTPDGIPRFPVIVQLYKEKRDA